MMSFWGSASPSPSNEEQAPSIALLQTATQTLHKENFNLREKLGAAQAVIDDYKENTLLEAQVDSVLLLEADRKYEKLHLQFVDMKKQRDQWEATCKEKTQNEKELCEAQIQAMTKKMEQTAARLEANKAQLVHSLLTAETDAEKAKEQFQVEKDVNIRQAAELSNARAIIKELQEECDRATNDGKEKLCALQLENHEAFDLYHKAEEEKMELTNTVQYLKTECARLQKLSEESMVTVQQSMEETISAYQEMEQEKSKVEARIQELQAEYANLQSAWEAKLAAYKEDANQALAACQKTGDERVQKKADEMSGKINELEESNGQLVQTLLTAESLADQAVKHLEAEQELTQRLKADISASEIKILQLQEEFARFQEKSQERITLLEEDKELVLSSSQQEASDKIQVLTCKLEATEEELKQTKFQLQEALQSILTIEEQSMHKMKIENDTNARLSAEISEAYNKIQSLVDDCVKLKSESDNNTIRIQGEADDAIAAAIKSSEEKAQAAVGKMYLKVAELEEANSQLSKQLRETKAGAPQETKQAGVATSAYALEAAQKVQSFHVSAPNSGHTAAPAPVAAERTQAKGDFAPFKAKMIAEGLNQFAIASFQHNYEQLVSGATCMVLESDIDPVQSLPKYEDAAGKYEEFGKHLEGGKGVLAQTLCCKLNGGLGTSMGLDKAKSLLPVKEGLSFLDFTAKQLLHLRQTHNTDVPFVVMNSFATSEDTKEALKQYPRLDAIEILQSKVPKVDAENLTPAEWPSNPHMEWCPPGHGDLYATLAGSGTLEMLMNKGYKYMFVSNSDNLGATMDLDVLAYFAQKDVPFMMEVCERMDSDKKGGHLARRKADGKLVLRESAQCCAQDAYNFHDITKHRFFNTNNLWVRLDMLAKMLMEFKGLLPLPLIKNSKTVDPKDGKSSKVYQLETAMGAAIECFGGALAMVVPRTRFAPVKTCSDLLVLRSDAYRVTEDWQLVLASGRVRPPHVTLDGDFYKHVEHLERTFGPSAPSLKGCDSLVVKGLVKVDTACSFEQTVELVNTSKECMDVLQGSYSGSYNLS